MNQIQSELKHMMQKNFSRNFIQVLWKSAWWKRSELWRLLLQPGLQPGCKQLQQPRPRVQSWQLESGWSMPM